MSSHVAVLLVKNSVDNPDGLPAEWHRDARASGPVLDPALAALGYQLMTAEEFDLRQTTLDADQKTWAANREQTKQTKIADRAQRARQRFAECRVIDADWENATNAQKFALARNVYKILNSVQSELIELIKEKGNDS